MFHCHCKPSFQDLPIPPSNIKQSLIARGVVFGNECFNRPLITVQFPDTWSYIHSFKDEEYWYIFDHKKRLVLRYIIYDSENYTFSTKRDKLPFTYPLPDFYIVVDNKLQFDDSTETGKFLYLLNSCQTTYQYYLKYPCDDFLIDLKDYYTDIIEYKKSVKYHYKEFRLYKKFLRDQLSPLTPKEIEIYCTSNRRKHQYRSFFKDGQLKTQTELYQDRVHNELEFLDKNDPDYVTNYNELITLHKEILPDYELLSIKAREELPPSGSREKCIII